MNALSRVSRAFCTRYLFVFLLSQTIIRNLVLAYRINFSNASNTSLQLEYRLNKAVQVFPYPRGINTRNGVTAYRWGDGSEAFGFMSGGQLWGKLSSILTLTTADPIDNRFLNQTYMYVCKLSPDVPSCLRVVDGCQAKSLCTQIGSLAYLNSLSQNVQNDSGTVLWNCTDTGYYVVWVAAPGAVTSLIHTAVVQGYVQALNPPLLGWTAFIEMSSDQIYARVSLLLASFGWAFVLLIAIWHYGVHRKEIQMYQIPKDIILVVVAHLIQCVIYSVSIHSSGEPHFVGEPMYTISLILTGLSTTSWYYLLFQMAKGISILRCQLGVVERWTRHISVLFVALSEVWNAVGGFGGYVAAVTVTLAVYMNMIIIARKTLYRLERYMHVLRNAADEDVTGVIDEAAEPPPSPIRPLTLAPIQPQHLQNRRPSQDNTAHPQAPNQSGSTISTGAQQSQLSGIYLLRPYPHRQTQSSMLITTSSNQLPSSPPFQSMRHSPTSPISIMGARAGNTIQQLLGCLFPACLSDRSRYAAILRPIRFLDTQWKPIENMDHKYTMVNGCFLLFSVAVFVELLIKVFDCIDVPSSPFPQLALTQSARLIMVSVLIYMFRMNQWPYVILLSKKLTRELLS